MASPRSFARAAQGCSLTRGRARRFGKFGALGRVVLPPSRAVAIIEFVEPTEARVAFRSLAYSKVRERVRVCVCVRACLCAPRAPSQSFAQFKSVPLYLEWAPLGVFKSPRKAATNAAPERAPEAAAAAAEAEEGGSGSSGSSTLFVKNLSFETTERKLRALFEEIGAR